MPYPKRPILKIIKGLPESTIMYFIEAMPREVIANCDKDDTGDQDVIKLMSSSPKKRSYWDYRDLYADLNIASLKTQLCQYLVGEGPYIGGAEAERSTEEYKKAVEKAKREGTDPDTSYDGFSRFSSTFADLLADMLRVHRDREHESRELVRENAVNFFARFFKDYRIESETMKEREYQRRFTSMLRYSHDLSLLVLAPFPVRNTPVENTGYFFDTLGFKNAGNGDFSAFRKRLRVRRALIALRAVFYFQFMYKKSVEAQFHPDKVRQRLEDEFGQMTKDMGGE